MQKVAKLLCECGVRTQKLGGLVAEAIALDPTLDLTTYHYRRQVYESCRAALAEANRRLAWKIADRNQGHGQPLVDLIGHANVGLMKAVEQFDPGLGFMFSTFAVPIIKNAVRKAVGEEVRPVRVPAHTREVAVRVHWARAELIGRTPDREPTYEEIVAHIRATKGKVVTAAEAERADLAMRPVGTLNTDPDGDDTAGQTLAGGEGVADATVMSSELASALTEVLSVLPYRQRMVLSLRYGLGDGWRYSFEECGRVLGRTWQAAQQLESRAISALKQPSIAGLLVGHL
jgi:RNA polymerase primary sigma factor